MPVLQLQQLIVLTCINLFLLYHLAAPRFSIDRLLSSFLDYQYHPRYKSLLAAFDVCLEPSHSVSFSVFLLLAHLTFHVADRLCLSTHHSDHPSVFHSLLKTLLFHKFFLPLTDVSDCAELHCRVWILCGAGNFLELKAFTSAVRRSKWNWSIRMHKPNIFTVARDSGRLLFFGRFYHGRHMVYIFALWFLLLSSSSSFSLLA